MALQESEDDDSPWWIILLVVVLTLGAACLASLLVLWRYRKKHRRTTLGRRESQARLTAELLTLETSDRGSEAGTDMNVDDFDDYGVCTKFDRKVSAPYTTPEAAVVDIPDDMHKGLIKGTQDTSGKATPLQDTSGKATPVPHTPVRDPERCLDSDVLLGSARGPTRDSRSLSPQRQASSDTAPDAAADTAQSPRQ